MDLEEFYMVLYGASNSVGIRYDVLKKWFRECSIIDGRLLTEEHFNISYERLCPNREDLSQSQFIQLIGILSRDLKTDVQTFVELFNRVKRIIIEEIVEMRKNDEYT